MPVSVNLGSYVLTDIPLFYVIVGSIVIGLLLAYVVYLFHAISTSLTLRGKNNEIKKDKADVLELTKRVHQLELENEKLKHSPSVEPEDPNAL
jgi:ketopantoate reductase